LCAEATHDCAARLPRPRAFTRKPVPSFECVGRGTLSITCLLALFDVRSSLRQARPPSRYPDLAPFFGPAPRGVLGKSCDLGRFAARLIADLRGNMPRYRDTSRRASDRNLLTPPQPIRNRDRLPEVSSDGALAHSMFGPTTRLPSSQMDVVRASRTNED
jgi:hypothetical protein